MMILAPGTQEVSEFREKAGESGGTIYEEMVDDYRFNRVEVSAIPSISTFRAVWKEHPSLAHVRMAKDKRNFQGCPQCIGLKAEIRRTQQAGDRVAWGVARAKLSAHRQLQRRERLVYYHRRHKARDEMSDCFSMIFDKWSSNTTTCPFLARSPVTCWQALKNKILRLHVMLVVAHLRGGNHNFFFTANESVVGGANFTTECLHRALLALANGGALKPTGYFQADSASDNKCHTVLYFLGYLVEHDMLRDAYLSMLVVHHTHEDVDQVFSVGLQYLYQGIQRIQLRTLHSQSLVP